MTEGYGTVDWVLFVRTHEAEARATGAIAGVINGQSVEPLESGGALSVDVGKNVRAASTISWWIPPLEGRQSCGQPANFIVRQEPLATLAAMRYRRTLRQELKPSGGGAPSASRMMPEMIGINRSATGIVAMEVNHPALLPLIDFRDQAAREDRHDLVLEIVPIDPAACLPSL